MEDSLALPGFPPSTCKFGSNEDDFVDSDDIANIRPARPSALQNKPLAEPNLVSVPTGHIKQEFRRRPAPQGWLHKMVSQLFLSSLITGVSMKFAREI